MTRPDTAGAGDVIRVLVATPLGRGGRGGIDRIMDELRGALTAPESGDVDVRFVTTRGQGHIALSPVFLARAIGQLAAARARRGVDVLHVNLSSHGSTRRKLILCRAARQMGVPYVLHLHGSRFRQYYDGLDAGRQAQVGAMMAGAARTIVLGAAWKRFVSERFPGAGDRVVVIPNASRAPAPRSRPSASPVTILFLGQVGERKGVPDLVEALSRLPREADWRAVIAGDGDLAAVRGRIAALGLADRVTLTGWVGPETVDRLLGEAHVLVLPSYDENLPMSVIEGMAHGLAVVTTPVGAVEDIIADGETGLLVPPGDPERLAAALERCVVDPALRQRLGTAAAAFHGAHLEIGPYRARLAALWRDAAAERRRP